jgi:hypothetical protein
MSISTLRAMFRRNYGSAYFVVGYRYQALLRTLDVWSALATQMVAEGANSKSGDHFVPALIEHI